MLQFQNVFSVDKFSGFDVKSSRCSVEGIFVCESEEMQKNGRKKLPDIQWKVQVRGSINFFAELSFLHIQSSAIKSNKFTSGIISK